MEKNISKNFDSLLSDEAKLYYNWVEGKLIHSTARKTPITPKNKSLFHKLIVSRFYADHNNSPSVKKAIKRMLSVLQNNGGDFGINVGSGTTNLHKRMINIDVVNNENVDVVVTGSTLPFADETIAIAISQEAIEHIADARQTVSEIHRVLARGGLFYCQVPFVIGFHPGPSDYWRFTRQALEYMFENENWTVEELEISVGHGTGFYRIAVEFFAVSVSILHHRLYIPTKGLFSILLYPFKWFDYLTRFSKQKDRMPGGYYCIARKK